VPSIELRSIKRLPFRHTAHLCAQHTSCTVRTATPYTFKKEYLQFLQNAEPMDKGSFISTFALYCEGSDFISQLTAEWGLQELSSVTSHPHGEVVPDRIPTGEKASSLLQTGSGAHATPYVIGTGLGREVYRSLLFSADVKNEWRHISAPLYVFMVCTRTPLPFLPLSPCSSTFYPVHYSRLITFVAIYC
jgi:hypothetical protein